MQNLEKNNSTRTDYTLQVYLNFKKKLYELLYNTINVIICTIKCVFAIT